MNEKPAELAASTESPVEINEEGPEDKPKPTDSNRRRLGLIYAILSPFLALAWLAPIITLLVLNFKGYIAGASVACGVLDIEKCAIPWGFNSTEALDRRDHNVLGSLQLVAKALEVWFIFLCGGLVYTLVMHIARKDERLPVRYLLTHKEFGDILSLCSLSFWKAPFQGSQTSRTNDETAGFPQAKTKWMLCGFMLFVAAITIIANLMGPAVAVLILPTLGWKETPIPRAMAFEQIATSRPPSNPVNTFGCLDPELLASGKYSCSASEMAMIVDTMIGNSGSTYSTAGVFSSTLGFMTYSFNVTDMFAIGTPVLSPTRQTMPELDNDFNEWYFSSSRTLKSALQVKYRRQAPALSSASQCYGGVTVVPVAEEKSVHCYNMINPDMAGMQGGGYPTGHDDPGELEDEPEDKPEDDSIPVSEGGLYPYPLIFPPSDINSGMPISVMCIRVGPAWGPANTRSSFSIAMSSSDDDVLIANAYGSDRAIYLDEATYPCISSGEDAGAKSCDWDAMFSQAPPPEFTYSASNPLVVEYSRPEYPTTWCRSFAYLKFPYYIMATSRSANPRLEVIVEDNTTPSPDDEPISVHPDWLLAALSVDKDDVIPYTRFAAQTIKSLLPTDELGIYQYSYFSRLHQVVFMNALSMVDYSMKPIDQAGPENPVMELSVLTYVWFYGLESRTSKMGLVIAILGSGIALLYIICSIFYRSVNHSLTDFVLIALKQDPPKIFNDIPDRDHGKVRVRIDNVENLKYEFKDAEQGTHAV